MKRLLAAVLAGLMLCSFAWAEKQPIDPKKPMVALTFDDGPTEHTQAILDMLAEFDCHATFFVVGNRIGSYEDTLRAVLAAGHEVGNHTWNHPDLTTLDSYKIGTNIRRCNERIYEATAYTPRYLRPPYGALSRKVYYEARALELITVKWSLDTLDWDVRNAEKIYRNIMDGISDGDIILCHDTVPESIEALRRAIPELMAQGYQFLTVGDLLSFAEQEVIYMTKYTELPPEKRKTGNVQN